MYSRVLLLFTLILSSSTLLFAQNDGDVPPNALPGKCYAKCYVPDRYEQQSEQIVERPAQQKVVVIPATYETVIDTILVHPASTQNEVVPPIYGYVADTIMLSSATTKWVKGQADATCLSDNPDNCRVMCLVQVPAQYRISTKKVMTAPASMKVITVPAEYKYVPRRVVKTPETSQIIETPATYRTITKSVLVSKGGFGEWHEILCANQVTEDRITQIQNALLKAGYDPGPIDNVLGAQTRAALLKYQKENGLPQGNLNLETLDKLGVSH